jgi:hypothetical protein
VEFTLLLLIVQTNTSPKSWGNRLNLVPASDCYYRASLTTYNLHYSFTIPSPPGTDNVFVNNKLPICTSSPESSTSQDYLFDQFVIYLWHNYEAHRHLPLFTDGRSHVHRNWQAGFQGKRHFLCNYKFFSGRKSFVCII